MGHWEGGSVIINSPLADLAQVAHAPRPADTRPTYSCHPARRSAATGCLRDRETLALVVRGAVNINYDNY